MNDLVKCLRTTARQMKMLGHKTWARIAEEAADAIKSEWIPCAERLPNGGEQVLICLEYPDGSKEVTLGEHWDKANENGWGGFGGNGVVTHWMYLPQPKEEE